MIRSESVKGGLLFSDLFLYTEARRHKSQAGLTKDELRFSRSGVFGTLISVNFRGI